MAGSSRRENDSADRQRTHAKMPTPREQIARLPRSSPSATSVTAPSPVAGATSFGDDSATGGSRQIRERIHRSCPTRHQACATGRRHRTPTRHPSGQYEQAEQRASSVGEAQAAVAQHKACFRGWSFAGTATSVPRNPKEEGPVLVRRERRPNQPPPQCAAGGRPRFLHIHRTSRIPKPENVVQET